VIGLLALKLVLSPTLIALITLAGRRWGSAVSGWLAGLPITGGPILLVIAVQLGDTFAADTARSALVGTAAFAAFCVAYVWTARRLPWWAALLAGYAAYAAMMTPCAAWHPSTLVAALFAAVVLIACALSLPQGPVTEVKSHSAWELPLRMAAAAAIVLAVTGLAHWLGPRWSGVLTIFPTAATVLGVFTQRAEGPNGAARVLRALMLGMLGFTACLAVVAATIERWGIGAAFGLGLIAALAAQGLTLVVQRYLNARAATRGTLPASLPPPA
jgi:hypothetical protein